jgi:diketogulonate reductase-like aldo/keto reductase
MFLDLPSGVRMPRLIYGTAWKKEATATLVQEALGAGFRGIDTACQPRHYHEAGVGEGLAAWLAAGQAREDIYLQTKFTPSDGQDPDRIPYDPNSPLPEQVQQSFAASLANLRTGYLDCLLLHSPLPNEQDLMAVWRAMEAIVRQGGARQIGISNCYRPELLAHLYDHAEVKPAVLQNRFYAATGYDREIRHYCRDHDMVYQSFWTLTANAHVLAHPLMQSLAAGYRLNPAQLLFRYLTQVGVVPLTGTTDSRHMREDLAIFSVTLDDDDLDAIDGLFQ